MNYHYSKGWLTIDHLIWSGLTAAQMWRDSDGDIPEVQTALNILSYSQYWGWCKAWEVLDERWILIKCSDGFPGWKNTYLED